MLQKHDASAGSEEYKDDGFVQLLATADLDKAEILCQAIANATSGQVLPSVQEEQVE